MWNFNNYNKLEIYFSAGVKYKGLYFLTAIYMNALFVYDERKNKLKFLLNFQKEKENKYLYLKAFLYNNEAWFIPYRADHIAIVNLETFLVEYITIHYRRKYGYTDLKYIDILNFKEEYICLIPQDIDSSMIINLKNRNVKVYYDIVKNNKNYSSAIFYEEKIYFYPWTADNILVLDLQTNERNYLPRQGIAESFGNVVFDDIFQNLFYAPARENYILQRSWNNNQYKKINILNWDDRKYKTFYCTNIKNIVFIWGHEKKVVLKVDKNSFEVKTYQIEHKSIGTFLTPIFGEGVDALVFGGNCIIKYDIEKDIFHNEYLRTTIKDLLREIKCSGIGFEKILGRNQEIFFEESKLYGLAYYILLLLGRKRKYSHLKKNVGNMIYKNI